MHNSDELLDWIETGLWQLPEVPEVTVNLNIPGILGSSAPKVPHPFVNVVGSTRWTTEEADERIAEVTEYFHSRGLPFGWVLGPHSTPSDLGERLARAGITKATEIAGMARSTVDLGASINPDVHIKQLTDPEEVLSHCDMFGKAFGMPTEAADVALRQQLPHENSGSGPGSIEYAIYVASIGSDPAPVSIATAAFPFGSTLLYLSGAATLPEARGQGVYTALVARRLADGLARGSTEAFIQAVRTTSAPILAKLGFREICNLEFYMSIPGEAASQTSA